MEQRRLCILLVVSLLGNAFSAPLELRLKRVDGDNELDSNEQEKDLMGAGSEIRPRRQEDSANNLDSPKEDADAEADSPSKVSIDTTTNKVDFATPVESDDDDDDDEDFDEPVTPAATTGGGSNIFSLLRLANALFPSSSSGGNGATKTAGEAASPLWTLKMDILRALLQFGTSVLGVASSSSSSASTG
ncbi:uncharacterized protein LOC113240138 isoform X2 [Hyposmocoma kahamanoa]|uniref:uncharacterized protein LOC113240138 isoform X2 n=1 Tax=Hyposmocoma kahamanoa TaxID=1477025 RepID=UPI000E6D8EEA|nr:uncharacterized protein LOC113240138 isoform X2 [Hyposmocoma kahamanoa]